MRYLLDTHVLFWAMSEENKLSSHVLDMINDPDNEIYFSTASVWEVVIKHAKSASSMPISGSDFLQGCLKAGFEPLPIENEHVLAVSKLKRKKNEPSHNDPFDRVLIAQAKTEKMIFITHDHLLGGYSEKNVLII